jgi:hypothetical protein
MKNKTNYDRLDAALAGIDKLTVLVQSQSANIELQSKNIETQSVQIKNLENQVIRLTKRVEELEAENAVLKSRVDKIEERLQLLDGQLKVIAPLVRHLVEAEGSLLLDPNYLELRDSEPIDAFTPVREIVKTNDLDLSQYKTESGGVSAVGKRLADLYYHVLGYTPRKSKGSYTYWLDTEHPIVETTVRLYNSLMQ